MKTTGIVRYIDNDNSIHIPKVVMEMLGISAGTPMEIFINNGNELILKAYDVSNGNIEDTQATERVFEAVQKAVAVVKETYGIDEQKGKREMSDNTATIKEQVLNMLYEYKDADRETHPINYGTILYFISKVRSMEEETENTK